MSKMYKNVRCPNYHTNTTKKQIYKRPLYKQTYKHNSKMFDKLCIITKHHSAPAQVNIINNIFYNIHLFVTINEYTDLRTLCDTSKSFSTLKKYIDYKLNKKYSLMYYDDILFRNIVVSKIYNPNKQLHLILNHCTKITDVSILGNCHTLDLSRCENITDVSALGNVHTLNLSECENITDVSALRNVHTLDLRYCENITDVGTLGNIHTLFLSFKDINISTLNINTLNINTLNLHGSFYQITDISVFTNIHTVNLYGVYQILDITNVHTINLYGFLLYD